MKFTHLTDNGQAKMVDVSDKRPTKREAWAKGRVILTEKVFKAIQDKALPKGDLFAVARVAGILAAKKVGELIPLCHPIPISAVEVDFKLEPENLSIEIEACVNTFAVTGVEMEALVAVSVAALTIYDMCKGLDKSLKITDIRLIKKTGGKSGTIILEQ